MQLTEREQEKMIVSLAAMIAQRRKDKGLKLNHPESVAIITDYILEGAREGKSVADLMIQVEATFVDGTKLVTIHDPIR